MNIEVTKFDLLNKLLSTTDEGLLNQLVEVFNKSEGKNERISVAQYNKEIDAAEERIKNGNFASHVDLERESEEW